jgi:hypothetical protein
MKLKPMVFAALAALCMTGGAEAALVERLGGKAYYDDVANLTWLQDANYAKTSGYDADGAMPWEQANTWVGSLNIDGVTGWRLPGGPMLGTHWNQTASEMGNLFYNVLGGTAETSLTLTHNANYNLFKNVQPTYYWSGVEIVPSDDPGYAWVFDFYWGFQAGGRKNDDHFVWAVRSGDVGASPVPLPATLFLLAPALAGLGFLRRRAS